MTQNQNNNLPEQLHLPPPLTPEAQKVIAKLPPHQQQAILQGIQSVQVQAVMHSGPLPAPEILSAYNATIPGAAERILAFTEDQMRHRITMEAQVIPQREVNSARGQHYALVIALAAIAGAVACAYLKQPIVGSVLVGTPLCGLAYAFLTGKQRQEKELAQKQVK